MTADVLLAIATFCSNYDKPDSVKCQGALVVCYESKQIAIGGQSNYALSKCVLRQLGIESK